MEKPGRPPQVDREGMRIVEVVNKTRSRGFMNTVTYIATGVCLALLLIACQKPAEKSGIATENNGKVNQSVQGASSEVRPAWQEAYLKFKRKNDVDIAENEQRIIELRKAVRKANTRFRASYSVRIDELERRNNELRDRTDNYRDEGDAKWAAFKHGSKRDMDKLKSLLKKTVIRDG